MTSESSCDFPRIKRRRVSKYLIIAAINTSREQKVYLLAKNFSSDFWHKKNAKKFQIFPTFCWIFKKMILKMKKPLKLKERQYYRGREDGL